MRVRKYALFKVLQKFNSLSDYFSRIEQVLILLYFSPTLSNLCIHLITLFLYLYLILIFVFPEPSTLLFIQTFIFAGFCQLHEKC